MAQYVQIMARGMNFRRHRKHGEYDFKSIHPVKELKIDSISLDKWLDNGTLRKRSKEQYNKYLNANPHVKNLQAVNTLIDTDAIEEEIAELSGQRLRNGMDKDEFWDSDETVKSGAKFRKHKPCGIVFKNKLDLLEHQCKAEKVQAETEWKPDEEEEEEDDDDDWDDDDDEEEESDEEDE